MGKKGLNPPLEEILMELDSIKIKKNATRKELMKIENKLNKLYFSKDLPQKLIPYTLLSITQGMLSDAFFQQYEQKLKSESYYVELKNKGITSLMLYSVFLVSAATILNQFLKKNKNNTVDICEAEFSYSNFY